VSNRRRALAVVLCAVSLIAVLFVVWNSNYVHEPVYKGKRLTGWVEQWKTNRWNIPKTASNRAAEKEAETAIRAIGTNAIPFLLASLKAREAKWRDYARNMLPRQWHAHLGLNGNRVGRRKEIGANGLAALGEQAAPAVPELIQLIRSSDKDASYLAVWALGSLRSGATSAIPVLVQCLTNPRQEIRIDAINSLAWIPDHSNTIVPALLEYVPAAKNRNGNGELCAILNALGMHQTNAIAAVPLLTELLQHPDFTVRGYATNGLIYINRKAAAEHGVHWP
jgi:HEAT repeat protein